MEETFKIITFISLMISTSSLLISLKSFIKTLRCDDNQLHLSALLGEVLQTVKLNIECNKQLCEFLSISVTDTQYAVTELLKRLDELAISDDVRLCLLQHLKTVLDLEKITRRK